MKRMYVLASNQLNYSKPYVQAAHALSQFALENPTQFKEWGNQTLVFLQCEDITRERDILQRRGLQCIPFHEPDYNNQLTAVSVFAESKHFKKYELI